jgi:hypothetical protein
VDAPAWAPCTPTYALAPADGQFDAPSESLRGGVDTCQLAAGPHLLLVESQDAAGNWGVPSAVWVQIAPVNYALALNACVAAQAGRPGTTVTYSLSVSQTGTLTDTATLSLAGNAWPVAAPGTLGPLAPGAGVTFPVTVTVPLTASLGSHDTVSVTVTSTGDSLIRHVIALDTRSSYSFWLPVVAHS